MDVVIAKKKEFKIIEKLGDRSYKVKRKNKEYFLKKIGLENDEFDKWIKDYKFLKTAGINMPKMRIIDKKEGIFVEDFIPGETVFDVLLWRDLENDYFRNVFVNEFYEKQDNFSLNYEPINWKLYNGKLYYLLHEYKRGFKEETSFTKRGIYYWFYTKEFADYALNRGKKKDLSRLKNEYETNREILKTVVQFHI